MVVGGAASCRPTKTVWIFVFDSTDLRGSTDLRVGLVNRR